MLREKHERDGVGVRGGESEKGKRETEKSG